MTKDRAIELLRMHQPRIQTDENCRLWVEAFAALGMLELDEPVNAEMRAGAILKAYVSGTETAAILMELSDAGLEIVEKQR